MVQAAAHRDARPDSMAAILEGIDCWATSRVFENLAADEVGLRSPQYGDLFNRQRIAVVGYVAPEVGEVIVS